MDSAESLLSASRSPPPPTPFHFHLQASNLTRVAACVNDALHARDARVPESERLDPIRERRSKKKRPARNIGPTRPTKPQPAAVQQQGASTEHVAAAEGQRGVPAAYLNKVPRSKVMIGGPEPEPVQGGKPLEQAGIILC